MCGKILVIIYSKYQSDCGRGRARSISFDVSMEDSGDESVSIDDTQNENNEGDSQKKIKVNSDSFPE